MERTEKVKETISDYKGILLREFIDLLTAAGEIAREMDVCQIYRASDGKTSVHFYDYEKFPFDGDELKRRTVKIRDDYEREEFYVEYENIEFSVFAPKEA